MRYSNDGNAAIHFACSQNNHEVVSLLLNANCQLTLKNHENRCPIDTTTDMTIQRMILTKSSFTHTLNSSNRLRYLTQLVSPFLTVTSFLIQSPTLLNLFALGIPIIPFSFLGANIMKFVANGVAEFMIFPFEFLTVWLLSS